MGRDGAATSTILRTGPTVLGIVNSIWGAFTLGSRGPGGRVLVSGFILPSSI